MHYDFNGPLGAPWTIPALEGLDAPWQVEAPLTSAADARMNSMLRSLRIVETVSALFGFQSIAAVTMVDGHVLVRLQNGRVLLDPKPAVGLMLSETPA